MNRKYSGIIKSIETAVFFFLLLIGSPVRLAGQDDNQLNEMIADCLNQSIEHYLKEPDDDIFIDVGGLPRSFPVDSISGASFIDCRFLRYHPRSVKKRLKARRNMSGPATYVLSVSYGLNDGQFVIIVRYDGLALVKKKAHIHVSDWGKFHYEYSAGNHRWDKVSTEFGGI